MWRNPQTGSRPERTRISLSRWRLVVAIIFLFAGAIVYKLFNLQIKQCDMYTAMAAGQQQVSSRLKPERGKIYFTENINNQEKLYPVATNKDFAVLYAIPKDVPDPRALAERFYEYFDRPRLEEELKKTASGTPLVIATSTKEELIGGYLKRLDRPDDLYEPLDNKKLDIDGLLDFYAYLASASSTPVSASDLALVNYQVVRKSASGTPATTLKIPGLDFNIENLRYYPEKEIGAHLLGFVSYASGEGAGKYGLEEFFNEELFGQYGSLKSEKGAKANVIIVNDREYIKPVAGADLVLTIDRNVEFTACEKLKEAVKKHGASGGSVVVMNPATGGIIAMCSVPDFDPNDFQAVKDLGVFKNPAVLDQYEPGSVFKTVTMSIALDQGKVVPSTTYNDTGEMMIKGWSKPIRNSDFTTHGPHGVVDMNTVLEYSLNTGAIFAMRQVGPKDFADYVKRYGFGEKTGIELGAEASGNIGNLLGSKVKEIDAATASFGQGIAATPLQMLMPYQVIANHGILMKPYIVKAVIHDGQREEIMPKQLGRVISAKTAATVSAMLVNVVELGHAKRAYINGYYVGGKTGTAQVADSGGYSKDRYIHTFVGIAPIDNPAFVMLTKINDPKDVQYAEGSALPLWSEIADFMLKYYQVPKTRK
ncbi:MAG: penicillin-binding protein 2 [Patescibacteria group bacterium]